MTPTIPSSPNTISVRVSAYMKNGSGFRKYLITERRGSGDLDDIEFMLRRPMTIVTSTSQQHKRRFEPRQILLGDCLADAIHRRKDHRDRRDLRPVCTEPLDIVQRLPDLIDLKIGQLPVLCGAGKPKLLVMYLDARHEFPQTRDITVA